MNNRKTFRVPKHIEHILEELEQKEVNFSKYVAYLIEKDNLQSIGEINKLYKESDEWYTPKYILDYFREEGWDFKFDPATNKEQLEYLDIPNGLTIEDDGIYKVWNRGEGDIWLNPPFSKQKEFVITARNNVDAFPYLKILMLLPYCPDKKYWKDHINGRAKIYIPENKIEFFNKDKEDITYGGVHKIVLVELTDYECNDIKIINFEEGETNE